MSCGPFVWLSNACWLSVEEREAKKRRPEGETKEEAGAPLRRLTETSGRGVEEGPIIKHFGAPVNTYWQEVGRSSRHYERQLCDP